MSSEEYNPLSDVNVEEFTPKYVLSLAEKAHAGQKYGEHDYVKYHVMGVLGHSLCLLNLSILETHAAAPWLITTCSILHDVCEDNPDFELPELGEAATRVLQLLTHDKGLHTYDGYIKNIMAGLKSNDYMTFLCSLVATIVKLSDMSFNLHNSLKGFMTGDRTEQDGCAYRVGKYTKHIPTLQAAYLNHS